MRELGHASIIAILYATGALIAVIISISPPPHAALLLPAASSVESFDGRSAVINGGAVAIVGETAYELPTKGMACQRDGRIFVVSESDVLVLRAGEARAIRYKLDLGGKPLSVACNGTAVTVAVAREASIAVYIVTTDGVVERYEGLPIGAGSSTAMALGKKAYLYAEGALFEISTSPKRYSALEDLVAYGVVEWGDSPVLFGKRGSVATVYFLDSGGVLELSVAGRETRVEAISCEGQWCRLLVVPEGDWVRVFEFNGRKYVGGAKVVGLKGVIYGRAGATERLWFSVAMPEVGVLAISPLSVGEAILGDNKRDLVKIEPAAPPRIERFRVPGRAESITLSYSKERLVSEAIELRRAEIEYSFLKPRDDVLGKILTAISLSSPIVAYAIRGALSTARGA